MTKQAVLFLCTGNSARSQMAEGLLKKYASDLMDVYSAGLEPKGVNPLAIQVMREIEIDISNQHSKDLSKFLGKGHISTVIILCSDAETRCPRIWPGIHERLFWPFEDPAITQGNEEFKVEKFREIRNQIQTKIKNWLTEKAQP